MTLIIHRVRHKTYLIFTYFGGIYRDAWLYGTNSIFITDPNEEDKVAGGGILIAYEHVSEQSADILLKTDVKKIYRVVHFKGKVIYELFTKENQLVASSVSSVSISKRGKVARLTNLE